MSVVNTEPGIPINIPKMPRLKMPKWPESYGMEREEIISKDCPFRVMVGPRTIQLEYMVDTQTTVGVKRQPMRLDVGSSIGTEKSEYGNPLGLAVYDVLVKYRALLEENTAMKALLEERAALEQKETPKGE